MLASLGAARQTARRSGHVAIRQASSSATTTATAGSSSSSAASKAANGRVTMPWEEYFKLRKSKRTWGTVAAIPTTITGVVVGGGAHTQLPTYGAGKLTRKIRLLCEPRNGSWNTDLGH